MKKLISYLALNYKKPVAKTLLSDILNTFDDVRQFILYPEIRFPLEKTFRLPSISSNDAEILVRNSERGTTIIFGHYLTNIPVYGENPGTGVGAILLEKKFNQGKK